jgi:CRISPR/Cas system-associated exonuclease Cas4 (RecB family)
MPSVSHSEVESYLSCRRKHWYGYGLSLQKVDSGAGLALGTFCHDVLAAFYRTLVEAGNTNSAQKKAMGAALVVARAKFVELVEKGYEDVDERRMTAEELLFKYYFPNEPLVNEGYVILEVEQEYNLEYDTESELRFPFVADLLVRTPDKRVSIVDHKFVGQFYNDRDPLIMPQIVKYIGAMRALGHRVDEGLYNLVKTTRIKGDKMTKTQLLDALAETGESREALLGIKATVADLQALAEDKGIEVYAGPKLEQLFLQIPVKPTNTRVQQTFIEQIDVADEIQRRKEMDAEDLDRVSYRTADKRICQGCSFFDLCTAELSGSNTKLLLQTEYKVRERRVFAEVSEEIDDA